GEQHVDRPRPPIDLPCGDVRQHWPDLAQHCADHALEHRAAMPGAKTLAVDDAYAAPLPHERLRQELAQRLLRLGDREAVKVDFPLHAIVAAAEPPQHGRLNAGTMENQLFTTRERGVHELAAQALLEHGEPVGTREACGWARLPAAAALRIRRRPGMSQRLDVTNRFAEQAGVLAAASGGGIFGRSGTHATSVEFCSSIVTRPRNGAWALQYHNSGQ